MSTVMFALGRLPGWIAQQKEMCETSGQRIYRPRQIYTGEKTCIRPLEKRSVTIYLKQKSVRVLPSRFFIFKPNVT
jgi:hypothetical protein